MLSVRQLAIVSKFSYRLYVIHWPDYLGVDHVIAEVNYWLWGLIMLFLLILLSHLSYRGFDSAFPKRKKRFSVS